MFANFMFNLNMISLSSLRFLSKQSQLQPHSQAKAWLLFMDLRIRIFIFCTTCRGTCQTGCKNHWTVPYMLSDVTSACAVWSVFSLSHSHRWEYQRITHLFYNAAAISDESALWIIQGALFKVTKKKLQIFQRIIWFFSLHQTRKYLGPLRSKIETEGFHHK